MILAIDVFYHEASATTAGVQFDQWSSSHIEKTYTCMNDHVNDYISGEFYKRELPCILKLLNDHQLKPDTIIIDGYVYLDDHKKPGLGKYLYDSLNGKCAIIGVAKNPYAKASSMHEVLRGKSHKPLHVTCEGISLENAIKNIHVMHGQYRLPTLLKNADQLCRGKAITQA